MLFQGGAKSETGITFLAHQLFLGAPGPPRGPFQIHPQITPISILRLPMEHLSSWTFLALYGGPMGQVWEACSLRGGGESVLDSWKKLKCLEIHIFGVDLEMLNQWP